MAVRIPLSAPFAVQKSFQDVNDSLADLQKQLDTTKATIPSTKDVEGLKKDVTRLSKTPTYLDPNDVFRKSGPAHMHGYVPDPGATPGATRYLCEDGTWGVPVGTPGVTDHPSLTHRSDAHQHPASSVDNTPYGHIASTDVQSALNELDDEKLARDGSQTMLGALPMNHFDINNINNATVEKDIFMTGGVGFATINPRKITMVGNESDAEARIEAVKALAFTAVTPTAEVARLAWDSVEKTLVYFVNSGA